jgi:PTS system mannose-specific IIC component
MLIQSVWVALAGGIICLDRVCLQAMISRPIVAAPITGTILGDPYTGLVIGTFIELLWLDRLPMGIYVPPNGTVVAVLITGCSVIVGNELGYISHELVAMAVLLFVPLGVVGQKIDVWIVRSNNGLSAEAVESAAKGDYKNISRIHLRGLFKIFWTSFGLIMVALVLGSTLLLWIYPFIPGKILKAFFYTYYFLPVLGIAVALNTVKIRGALPVFSGIFLIVFLIAEFL